MLKCIKIECIQHGIESNFEIFLFMGNLQQK